MPKLYTLQEANDMLPRLTALLQEMQARGVQLAQIGAQQGVIRRKIMGNGHHTEREDAELKKAERPIEEAIRSALGLLEEWSIELKDLQRGLIDFPAMREGRVVYLCWELGEPEIAYWHETTTGYTGRQPVDDGFA
jgi:hypothetical protein